MTADNCALVQAQTYGVMTAIAQQQAWFVPAPNGSFWHKTDEDRWFRQCPLSGAKETSIVVGDYVRL
jgi:hypothetical protein